MSSEYKERSFLDEPISPWLGLSVATSPIWIGLIAFMCSRCVDAKEVPIDKISNKVVDIISVSKIDTTEVQEKIINILEKK